MTAYIDLPPEVREKFRQAGKRGGLANAARNDMGVAAARARAGQDAKWLFGHGCAVCGPRIDVPIDLAIGERERRGRALKKRHYVLMAMRRHGR